MGAFLIANFGIPEFLRSIPETVGGDRVASLQLRKKAKNDRFLLDSNHPILELTIT
jgi:hypothetical protein